MLLLLLLLLLMRRWCRPRSPTARCGLSTTRRLSAWVRRPSLSTASAYTAAAARHVGREPTGGGGHFALGLAPPAPDQAHGGPQPRLASAGLSQWAAISLLSPSYLPAGQPLIPAVLPTPRRHTALRRVDGDMHAAARQHERLGGAGSRRAVRAGPAGAHHTRAESLLIWSPRAA